MPIGDNIPARIPSSTGINRYVSKTGNDTTGDGSSSTPWLTIQKALDTVTLGDIIRVRDGTYTENPDWTRGTGASDAITTLMPDDGHSFIISGGVLVHVGGGARAGRFRIRGKADNESTPRMAITGAGSAQPDGVKVESGRDVEIFGVHIHDNNYTPGGGAAGSQGILVASVNNITNENIQIISNLIHDNGGDPGKDHGIYYGSTFGGASDQTNGGAIYNNVIYRNNANNIQFYANADGCIIVCNTVDEAIGSENIWLGGSASKSCDNNTVNNNIATNALGGVSGNGYGIRTFWEEGAGGPIGTGNVVRNNDIQGNALTGANNFVKIDGGETGQTTVSDNINGNPSYVDRTNRNYHLAAGSPAIKAGLEAYTPTFDYDGKNRLHADMGAFAYTADDWHGRGTP